MRALARRAGVAVDGVLGGCAVHARDFVAGVAPAWGAEFGDDGLDGGAQLGADQTAQFRHAVGLLGAQGQAAVAGPIFVGEGAVGVEAVGHRLGQFGEVFGAELGSELGEAGFGVVAGRGVDPAGQPVVEVADHRDLTGSQLALALRRGGGGQGGRQRFTGQAVAYAQIARLLDAPGRFGAADQGPFSQRMGQCAAQFQGRGLAGKGIDQRMLQGRDAPAQLFAALQHRQLLPGGQRVQRQRAGTVQVGIERVEHRVDIVLTTWTHTTKLATHTDKNRRPETTETTVTQVISVCVFAIRILVHVRREGR